MRRLCDLETMEHRDLGKAQKERNSAAAASVPATIRIGSGAMAIPQVASVEAIRMV